MNLLQKAKILGDAGQYDSCGPKACEVKVKNSLGGLYHAQSELKDCRMLKTLMNNSCSLDCKYCGNSTCSKRKQKVAYKPKELQKVFSHVRRNLNVNSLFLSSGVAGNADLATENMLEAVRLVRKDFRGYVHFKVLPGTSFDLIKQASELSNRMSINIEAPNKHAMNEMSSTKEYKSDILKRQAWMKNLKVNQTTQMIVNDMVTDKEVLSMIDWEYKEMELKRVYYSAFRPVKGTPFENKKAESPIRQNHLYNVDFLMRFYDYKHKEFSAIMDDGMLPKEDPKLALAKANFSGPLDINEASYEELIRVPGIGPKTAEKIRDHKKITKYEQLWRMGVRINRAKPFLNVDGKRQMMLNCF